MNREPLSSLLQPCAALSNLQRVGQTTSHRPLLSKLSCALLGSTGALGALERAYEHLRGPTAGPPKKKKTGAGMRTGDRRQRVRARRCRARERTSRGLVPIHSRKFAPIRGLPSQPQSPFPPQLSGRPNEENHLYAVVSPWYDLSRTFSITPLTLAHALAPPSYDLSRPSSITPPRRPRSFCETNPIGSALVT